MALLNDNCPPEALSKNVYLDSIVANVPYGNVDSHPVEVPPIADSSDPLINSIMMGSMALTPASGAYPPDHKDKVGWNGDSEREWFAELASRSDEMVAMADGGQMHPDAARSVKRLAAGARDELNQVGDLYGRWGNARIPAKKNNSPFSYYQMMNGVGPMGLDLSRNAILDFAEGFDDGADTGARLDSYAFLLQGETGGWNPQVAGAEPTTANFWKAIRDAQQRDRNWIRAAYGRVHRLLYCAEYGVAQSESYNANKLAGGGGYAPQADVPRQASIIPGAISRVARIIPTALPGGGDDTDPADTGPAAPTPAPPAEPPSTVRWYQTTAGKVALAGATVAAVGGLGYGIYRFTTRRRALAF